MKELESNGSSHMNSRKNAVNAHKLSSSDFFYSLLPAHWKVWPILRVGDTARLQSPSHMSVLAGNVLLAHRAELHQVYEDQRSHEP